MQKLAIEPGDDTCPPWWPSIIWELHHPHHTGGIIPHHSPVNYPPAINDIMASLAIHTFTYLMQDQKCAQEIRTQVEGKIAATAKQ